MLISELNTGVVWALGVLLVLALVGIFSPPSRRKIRTWLARRSRARYEFLKNEISKRHFGGYAGLIVDFPGRKFKEAELRVFFRLPMYHVVMNQDKKLCIFWHRERLTKEIGTGAALKEGEVITPEKPGRFSVVPDASTVDEKSAEVKTS